MFKTILTAALLLISSMAHSERTITEGKPSTLSSITVSSLTAHVDMGGTLTTVSTITAPAILLPGGLITGPGGAGETNTYASSKTFTSSVLLESTVTIGTVDYFDIYGNLFIDSTDYEGGGIITTIIADSTSPLASPGIGLIMYGSGNTLELNSGGVGIFPAENTGFFAEGFSGVSVIDLTTTAQINSPLIQLQGYNNGLYNTTVSIEGAVIATSGTFTNTGFNQYAVIASTTIKILAGGIQWPDGTISTTAARSGPGGGTTYSADEVSLHLNGTTFSVLATSVTLQGNTFNGINELVKTNGSGAMTTATTGNAATATALATAGSTSSSGYLCRGVDALGNCLPAFVATTSVSGSTNPVTSGALFTGLATKQASFTGISSACATGQYMSTMTIVNGVITGGTCLTIPAYTEIFLSTGNPNTGSTGIFYSTTTNGVTPRSIIFEMWAGGGGGGAAQTNVGGSGTATVFGSTSAAFGVGGSSGTATTGSGTDNGGAGGTQVCPTGCDCTNGAAGGYGSISGNFDNSISGSGAATSRGGAGLTCAANNLNCLGQNASMGTGSGGSGGGSNGANYTGAGGGGAGQRIKCVISSPSASYSYTIGQPGAGGINTSYPTLSGGAGGSGFISLTLIY